MESANITTNDFKEDISISLDPDQKIKLGICAMEKKINSKHMQNILKGLLVFDEFEIIIFSEETLFNHDIEEWPIVDAMIIFFSDGFPYNKGLKYIQLRNPFLINDFEMQKIFWDRRKVLKILEGKHIPTPYNVIVDRGEEINNDGEVSPKQINKNEVETMIKNYCHMRNPKRPSLRSNGNKEPIGPNDGINCISHLTSVEMLAENLSSKHSEFFDFNNIDECELELLEGKKSACSMINPDVEKELIEYDDHIDFRGKKLFKPFVEKPCNGDDHNIYIYYPPSHGGGHKRLFRKTINLSSLYIPNADTIRRDKSYIYEEFMQTDGFDVKVYTIGPEYAHAEARKSPSLDGKVKRSREGKEIRFPINLTPFEKDLARQIVTIFKQNICGFDILRANGYSYVSDVNGWSFVKGNMKYYEDCAILIRKMILQKLDKGRLLKKPKELKEVPIYKDLQLHRTEDGTKYADELRSVVAVFRHSDRSPKQKMKLVVNEPAILSLFDKFGSVSSYSNNTNDISDEFNQPYKEIKLKKPKELTEVLNIVTEILKKNNIDERSIFALNDNFFTKLFQLKMILEKNLNFEGMTRKIQMKPLKVNAQIIEGKKKYSIEEALMIIKWGGNLTHAGIEQARLLGRTFRVQMYPSYSGDEDGLLRLHSTYRHDLKCYSSDEGRCLKTAASFLQGLLELEGHLIPIISSMVRKDEAVSQLLDVTCDQISDVKKKVKEELSECLHHNGPLVDKFKCLFTEQALFKRKEEDAPIFELMSQIENPYEKMQVIYELMDRVIQHFKTLLSKEEIELECGTYFIRSHISIQKRHLSSTGNTQTVSKLSLHDIETENICTGSSNKSSLTPKTSSNSKLAIFSPSIMFHSGRTKVEAQPTSSHAKPKSVSFFSGVHSRKEKDKITTLSRSYSNLPMDSEGLGDHNDFDCEDEKIILIFKRWIKLHQDFYNRTTQKFDISKVPDIYDNVKYDIIHNRELLSEDAFHLFYHINLLANFVMPLEYGITVEEKVKIGIKVIGALLNKIHRDLIWWQVNNPYRNKWLNTDVDKSEVSYSGLDESKLNSDDIKSSWRHVKTRFYFTCASHLYSLVNTIIFGYDSFLIDQSQANHSSLKELKTVFDLDYCTHIIFRLYENFNVGQDNPKRFRLEIIFSPGSNKDPQEADKNHMISVCPWIVLNNNLTLQQMKEFFFKLMVETNEEEHDLNIPAV